jgi:hypothetical protein
MLKVLCVFKKIALLILSGLMVYLIAGFLSVLPLRKKVREVGYNKALLTLSERILEKVKRGEPSFDVEKMLDNIVQQDLIDGLSDDDAKKTFWINIYNAWYQLLAAREKLGNPVIFTKKVIPIAGTKFSLDDIEHGILRKYRWKYSLGYFPSFFPGKLIKSLAVDKIDYRIHFALNCGAVSCPPILFYSYDNIENQLNLATRSFLLSETEIDYDKKEARVSKILDWFRGDFGGKAGMRNIIGSAFEKNIGNYNIKFKDYDWSVKLNNFE